MRGEPLMPTSPRKARVLLESGRAEAERREPFTIRLLYASGENRQPVTLGIDAGYENIGFSAVTEKAELISGEVSLLKRMSERLKEKAMYRTQRRNRLRHRKPRSDNRSRPDGWLAPSIQHKADSHIKIADLTKRILPVTQIIVEVANFDIQQIRNPQIQGKEYQNGEQSGYWNLREYILHRDSRKCQNPGCKNRAEVPILEVHHIGFQKKDRSDRPGNLITLCTKCHTPGNHKKGKFLHGWEPKVKSFRPETFMSTVRWKIVNTLECQHTYGHLTKQKRHEFGLPKSHANDAFAIAGGSQKRTEILFFRQRRKSSRCLEKFYDAKFTDIRTGRKASGTDLHCGRRTRNRNLNTENLRKYRGQKLSKGKRVIRKQRYSIRPGDLIEFSGKIYTAKGVHCNGSRVMLGSSSKAVSVAVKNTRVIFHKKTLQTERAPFPLPPEVGSLHGEF
ncbi:MAG: paclitaxel/taxanoid biosynthesis susceptibility protein TS1 [Desulfobacterales bacterium]|nr:paclitaxel/taxanoid biosynthesis susceptibility protein TS1 [Desulfobacterales bacterium]